MRGTDPDTNSTEAVRARRWFRRTPLLSLVVAAALFPLAGLGASAATQPDDDVLVLGAEVYTAVCSSCHQPGGVGVAGNFPPRGWP